MSPTSDSLCWRYMGSASASELRGTNCYFLALKHVSLNHECRDITYLGEQSRKSKIYQDYMPLYGECYLHIHEQHHLNSVINVSLNYLHLGITTILISTIIGLPIVELYYFSNKPIDLIYCILCAYSPFIFILVLCDGLSNYLSNGEVNYNKDPISGQYPVGTTASFTCKSGYSLKGSRSRTCQTSRYWTQWTFCEQSKVILIWNTHNCFVVYIFPDNLKSV